MLDNMDPAIWGKHYWDVIHIITLTYPENPTEQDKQNVKNFFRLLQSLLPCTTCTKHYIQNLQNFPLTDDVLSNKQKIIKWAVDLHNQVNKQTGKNIFDINEIYNKYTKKEMSIKSKITIILTIVLIILLIIYVKLK